MDDTSENEGNRYDSNGGGGGGGEDEIKVITKLPRSFGSASQHRQPQKTRRGNGSIQITYKPPSRFRDYSTKPDMTFLLSNPIPDVLHHSSEYFHGCMVMIENTAYARLLQPNDGKQQQQQEKITTKDILSLRSKVFDYYIRNRDSLDQDHRNVIWSIICRLRVMTFKGEDRFGEYDSNSKLATDYSLLVSRLHVSKYKLGTLWRALQVIIAKISNIRYRIELDKYVQYLEASCGRFLFMAENSRGKEFLDYDLLIVKRDNTSSVTVNMKFLTDTEKIFYGIYSTYLPSMCVLGFYGVSPTTTTISRFVTIERSELLTSKENVNNILTWMDLSSSGTIREFVEKDIYNGICNANLHLGEKELYEELEKFVNPSAQQVISKYRPEFIDELVKWVYDEPISKIIKAVRKKYERDISTKMKEEEKRNRDAKILLKKKSKEESSSDDSESDESSTTTASDDEEEEIPVKNDTLIDINFDVLTMSILMNFFKSTFSNYSIEEYLIKMPFLDPKGYLFRRFQPEIYYDSINGESVKLELFIPKMMQVSNEYYLLVPRERKLIFYPSLMEVFAGWVVYICESDEFNGLLKNGNIDLIHTYTLLLPSRAAQNRERITKFRHEKRRKDKEKRFDMPYSSGNITEGLMNITIENSSGSNTIVSL